MKLKPIYINDNFDIMSVIDKEICELSGGQQKKIDLEINDDSVK